MNFSPEPTTSRQAPPPPPRTSRPSTQPPSFDHPRRQRWAGRSRTRRWVQAAVALAILGASAGTTTALLIGLGRLLGQLSFPADGLIGGTIVLGVLAWIAASGRPRARRLIARERLRRDRLRLYDRLAELWGQALLAAADEADGLLDLGAFWPVERQLALIGSRRVVRRYVALRDGGLQASPAAEARFADLIAAMRRDLLPADFAPASPCLGRLTARLGPAAPRSAAMHITLPIARRQRAGKPSLDVSVMHPPPASP